ncbi:MAG: hypothetical protein AB1402_03090 [Bacillota bacterium]
MDLSWVVQTATLLAISTIAYFLRDLKKRIDEEIKENKEAIAQVSRDCQDEARRLERGLNELKADLPFIYTAKDDFIRFAGILEKKLDRIQSWIERKGA